MTKWEEKEEKREERKHDEDVTAAEYQSGAATADEFVESVGVRLKRRADELEGTPLCGSAAREWRMALAGELRTLAATLEA